MISHIHANYEWYLQQRALYLFPSSLSIFILCLYLPSLIASIFHGSVILELCFIPSLLVALRFGVSLIFNLYSYFIPTIVSVYLSHLLSGS
uniref:Uncharacterized protein n=1 Tax=Arundo donax TaxID=35708 RepID=A0A0A9FUV5_ARUDO